MSILHSSAARNIDGALLLHVRSVLHKYGLPAPTAKAALEATGATKTRAYALAAAFPDTLASLVQAPGRPTKETTKPTDASEATDITRRVLEFIFGNPGCAWRTGDGGRLKSTPEFKQFIVELCHAHHELGTETLAAATQVAWSTLREWLREARTETASAATDQPPERPSAHESTAISTPIGQCERQVQLVVHEWRTWAGAFSKFCTHMERNHRVELGRTAISTVLEHAGERQPKRRRGRSPDEAALANSFETFFANAQWVGDGKQVGIKIGEQDFTFNLELMVDAKSGAYVGVSVRDEEDAEGVVEAYEEGLQTTVSRPLAVLLDNKACNTTENVESAIEDSIFILATLARAQNKAHVEGSFGLFSQHVPQMTISDASPRELARGIAELVIRTFFNAFNMRPRRAKNGKTRIELNTTDNPTPAETEAARASLRKRQKQQIRARETRKLRQNPDVLAYLDEAFEKHGLKDKGGKVKNAMARYSLEDATDAIGIFAVKVERDSLPPGLKETGRYVLGITRNLAHEREGVAIARALWDERIRAREIAFAGLRSTQSQIESESESPSQQIVALVDAGMKSERNIDLHYWLSAACEYIVGRADDAIHRKALYEITARRIHTHYAVSPRERQSAIRFIARNLLPVS